jgi:hypothetical protein
LEKRVKGSDETEVESDGVLGVLDRRSALGVEDGVCNGTMGRSWTSIRLYSPNA